MSEIKLSTDVTVKPSPWKVSYYSKVLTIGSCFADVVSTQLEQNKYKVLPNVLGTVFNPYSIAKLLTLSLTDALPHVGHYVSLNDQYYVNYDFHSSIYSDSTLDDFDTKLRNVLRRTKQSLQEAEVLIMTFGSSFAYRHLNSGELITNCHKSPAAWFQKELLSLEFQKEALNNVIERLKTINPKLRIILTISPVRHTKDTLPMNQVSKSILRLLAHELQTEHNHVDYFPAYEIMMDELRDYRFYEPDLIHPNSVAVDTIFRRFLNTYMSVDTLELQKEWNHVSQMFHHKPLHGYSEEYKRHLIQTKERMMRLDMLLDVKSELNALDEILKTHYS